MEYSITLNDQELNILSAALVELPFKVAAPLVAKINQQIAKQQSPVEAPQAKEAEQPA